MPALISADWGRSAQDFGDDEHRTWRHVHMLYHIMKHATHTTSYQHIHYRVDILHRFRRWSLHNFAQNIDLNNWHFSHHVNGDGKRFYTRDWICKSMLFWAKAWLICRYVSMNIINIGQYQTISFRALQEQMLGVIYDYYAVATQQEGPGFDSG